MRIIKCFFGILVLLLLLSLSLSALDFVYPAKVERVIDGDTIVVDLYLGLGVILDDQYIRLYGINAFEIQGIEREKGLEAKEYLARRLQEGKVVEIEIKPEWGSRGKGEYGRWLAVVYIDGVNVNAELIEKKHAEKYKEGDT